MKKQFKRLSLARGFTLIEVMVVVVIIAILAAIVVPRIMSRPEQARIVRAKSDIMAIQNAMDLYRLDNGSYPTTQQGIAALVKKPSGEPEPQDWQPGGYLKNVPKDPWDHYYHYASPGAHGAIDIWSYGPKNKPGNKTISNWTTSKKL